MPLMSTLVAYVACPSVTTFFSGWLEVFITEGSRDKNRHLFIHTTTDDRWAWSMAPISWTSSGIL